MGGGGDSLQGTIRGGDSSNDPNCQFEQTNKYFMHNLITLNKNFSKKFQSKNLMKLFNSCINYAISCCF